MIRQILLATLATTSAVTGFTLPTSTTLSSTHSPTSLSAFDNNDNVNLIESSYDPLNLSDDLDYFYTSSESNGRTNNAAAIAITALLTTPLSASAAGPDWGIFEGRTGSLLHPAAMAAMAAFSISTALLGFQWRRQRTLGDEIKALKSTLPNLNGASSVKEAIAAAESAESVDASYVSTLKGALSIESEIEALTNERKELASAGPRDKHFNQGSLLLFIGTAFAIEVRLFLFVYIVHSTYDTCIGASVMS